MIGVRNELAVFNSPAVQSAIVSSEFQDYFPAYIPTESNMEFVVKGNQEDYIDLNDTQLYLKLKFTMPSDYKSTDEIVKQKRCFPENLLIGSLFSKVSLYLNETLVDGNDSLYAYRAVLNSILATEWVDKGTRMTSWGYAPLDNDKKKLMATETFEMELLGPLFLDMFQQPQLLLPLIDIRLQFHRQPSAFFLRTEKHANADTLPWTVSLEKAILKMKKVRVNKNIYQAHSVGLLKRPSLYPIQRTCMQSFIIPQGQSSFVFESIFNDISPKVIVTALVNSNASTNSQLDPFKFEHFKLNHFALYRDGSAKIYQPNFNKKLCVNEFMALYNTFSSNIGLTFNDFTSNMSLLVTNLSADMNIHEVQERKIMNLRMEMKFEEALAQNVTVINMAICDGMVIIDKNLRVTMS